jgi:hypothetical protein
MNGLNDRVFPSDHRLAPALFSLALRAKCPKTLTLPFAGCFHDFGSALSGFLPRKGCFLNLVGVAFQNFIRQNQRELD